MVISTKRRLVRFLRIAAPAADAIGLVGITFFLITHLSWEVISQEPATGGDMGSHFWPLYTLVKYALPDWSLRTWNPGNLGGEPHLVHYFPFPYLVMAVLSAVMPLGRAFNIGTVLPLALLPFAVYVCMRGLRHRFPTPLVSACLSLCFLYNEGNSMWGGNTLSLLAGQFAHAYGFVFLLLGLGAFSHELHRGRAPLVSSICFAAVACSHAYVLFAVPLFVVSVLCFDRWGSFWRRFRFSLEAALLSSLLSVWFIVPMIENSCWTTPFVVIWRSGKLLSESVPPIFYPVLGLLILSLLLESFLAGRIGRRKMLRVVGFWALPSVFFVAFYFLFPRVGLVDVRAIPQLQLNVCLLTGAALGPLMRRMGRMGNWCLSFPSLVLTLWWVDGNVESFSSWVRWNYSGWSTKPLYPDLRNLADYLRGDFSDPRVVYENSDANNAAGTMRVFEMLPYFARRSTLESVYLQASILAPEAFHIQGLVSKTPSCPFSAYKCAQYNLAEAEDKLRLMGVGDLILRTDELVGQASQSSYLERKASFGPWHVYRLKGESSYAGFFPSLPQVAQGGDFKDVFLDWFDKYTKESRFLLFETNAVSPAPLLENEQAWMGTEECRTEVKVGFGRLVLQTTCPGKAHYLKFAYHPTWVADSGDKIFLVSPGFMGIIPTREKVTLRFGQDMVWKLCSMVSLVTLLLILVLPVVGRIIR